MISTWEGNLEPFAFFIFLWGNSLKQHLPENLRSTLSGISISGIFTFIFTATKSSVKNCLDGTTEYKNICVSLCRNETIKTNSWNFQRVKTNVFYALEQIIISLNKNDCRPLFFKLLVGDLRTEMLVDFFLKLRYFVSSFRPLLWYRLGFLVVAHTAYFFVVFLSQLVFLKLPQQALLLAQMQVGSMVNCFQFCGIVCSVSHL